MTIYIDDHEDAILTRLEIHHNLVKSEAGLNGVFKDFPLGSVPWDSYPFIMVVPGDQRFTWLSSSDVEIEQPFEVTAIVAPRIYDTGISGESQGLKIGRGIGNILVNRYIGHPQLQTDELGELPYLEGVLIRGKRGVVLEAGQSGDKTAKYPEYVGVRIILATMIRQYIAGSKISRGF